MSIKVESILRQIIFQEGESRVRELKVDIMPTIDGNKVRLWIANSVPNEPDGGELLIRKEEWAAIVAYVANKFDSTE